MSRELHVDDYADSAAVYVHVPFCAAVCPYCDFAVVAGRDDLSTRYLEAVVAEIEMSARWRPLDSVFFGGGTPSRVDPGLLAAVLAALGDRHGMVPGAEVSLEVNPEDVDEGRAASWQEAGFNRVSLGAQSFDPVVLAALGRRHDGRTVTEAVVALRRAGFDNLSLDLIFGTPGESDDSWLATLRRALATGVDHVSCYALTVEAGTPLGRAVRAGAAAPDPDVQADRYQTADRVLGEAGLRRYEVSNWCRPGHQCRYNLTVWAQGEYEAYGNGAHRHRNGVRSRNIRRVEAYIERVERGERPVAGAEPLEGWERELDRLFVGLRRTEGVRPGPGVEALLSDPRSRALVEHGVIEVGEGRLRVARPLLGDEVSRLVLDLSPPRGWEQSGDEDNV